MRSYLDFEGVYDKTKRYIVNNWSDEDFTQRFGSETNYNDTKVIETQPEYGLTIKAGEMRELGQFEAFTFTKHFVDREIYKEAAKLSDRVLRERAEMGVNNREIRKPFEDKTVKEIKAGQATPFMDKIREEIRQEEIAKLNATPEEKPVDKRTKEYKESVKEFEE